MREEMRVLSLALGSDVCATRSKAIAMKAYIGQTLRFEEAEGGGGGEGRGGDRLLDLITTMSNRALTGSKCCVSPNKYRTW
jgi:hypothetical protein